MPELGSILGRLSPLSVVPGEKTGKKTILFYGPVGRSVLLGNFFMAPIWFKGDIYLCAEAVYQRIKLDNSTLSGNKKKEIQLALQCANGHFAWLLGRAIPLSRKIPHEDTIKHMISVINAKFTTNIFSNPSPPLLELAQHFGLQNKWLVEYCPSRPVGWSSNNSYTPSDSGQNYLGRIIMSVLKGLQDGKDISSIDIDQFALEMLDNWDNNEFQSLQGNFQEEQEDPTKCEYCKVRPKAKGRFCDGECYNFWVICKLALEELGMCSLCGRNKIHKGSPFCSIICRDDACKNCGRRYKNKKLKSDCCGRTCADSYSLVPKCLLNGCDRPTNGFLCCSKKCHDEKCMVRDCPWPKIVGHNHCSRTCSKKSGR